MSRELLAIEAWRAKLEAEVQDVDRQRKARRAAPARTRRTSRRTARTKRAAVESSSHATRYRARLKLTLD